jgi:hypothetical protein
VVQKRSAVSPPETTCQLLSEWIRGVLHVQTEVKSIAKVASVLQGVYQSRQGMRPVVRNDADINARYIPIYESQSGTITKIDKNALCHSTSDKAPIQSE